MAAPQNLMEYWAQDIAAQERIAAAIEALVIVMEALVVQALGTHSALDSIEGDVSTNLERIAVRADRGPFR